MTKRDFTYSAPPAGDENAQVGGWQWITQEMLLSPAWRTMSLASRKVVDRIIIEHLRHDRRENGELVVTYDDFVAYGIRRQSVKPAIEEAIRLGWIDRTAKGVRSFGAARRPSKYGLTWIGRKDHTAPSNRWRRSVPIADMHSSCGSGTGATSQRSAIPSVASGTGGVAKTVLGNG